jgi:hypothetical protein
LGELRPLPRRSPRAEELIARRKHLPFVDPDELRRDVDAIVDPAL